MLKNSMKKKRGKGFTLIELIIVIAIIAILAALIIPKFGDIKEKANAKADISNAKNIQSAAVVFDEENPKAITTTWQALSAVTDSNGKTLENSLQSVPKAKAKDYKDSDFYVEKDANGDIIVGVKKSASGSSEEEIYPSAGTNTPYKLD
ncbi:prepilin-type N-terminal cleavage/methylation domain-containing protein [Clostridium sp. HBUAS56017]|uniref:prepilin-type N-terminal cleavage/methylation domain-containing protein n=1 Tax=Clostridium sp. HBUAS56017 TaxID=2571128 RepID=UPI001A9BC27D|nr:prepilin-type N-terminal cleavage/methylation domain-containing protein [Clostridium sp. HBUAS56017]